MLSLTRRLQMSGEARARRILIVVARHQRKLTFKAVILDRSLRENSITALPVPERPDCELEQP